MKPCGRVGGVYLPPQAKREGRGVRGQKRDCGEGEREKVSNQEEENKEEAKEEHMRSIKKNIKKQKNKLLVQIA